MLRSSSEPRLVQFYIRRGSDELLSFKKPSEDLPPRHPSRTITFDFHPIPLRYDFMNPKTSGGATNGKVLQFPNGLKPSGLST